MELCTQMFQKKQLLPGITVRKTRAPYQCISRRHDSDAKTVTQSRMNCLSCNVIFTLFWYNLF